MSKSKKEKSSHKGCSNWQGRRDSNTQPTVLETVALPLSHSPKNLLILAKASVPVKKEDFQTKALGLHDKGQKFKIAFGFHLLAGNKAQADTVDTVAQPTHILRSIRKNMSQMIAVAAALHFNA